MNPMFDKSHWYRPTFEERGKDRARERELTLIGWLSFGVGVLVGVSLAIGFYGITGG